MSKRVLVYGMTDNPGGIETYLINTMHELKKQGMVLDFICDFPDIAYKEEILANGSKIYFIPAKSKNLITHWVEILKVLKKHKEYRTVYFNILDAGAAFSMLIPWMLRRRIVVHSHNGETDKKRLHQLCRPIMVFMAKRYLACSKVASDFMFGTNPKIQGKVAIIPNAIDVKKYAYNEEIRRVKRKELNLLNGEKVVCHVGRLSMQKNPFGMLDIFKALLIKEKNVILLSIGTGEIETEVKLYAKKLGISDSVRFLGKRLDVQELMQAADVFFLPSFYEGLPIVAIEAQAAGLQCVISDRISRETDITGNVHFLSLDAPVNQWVDTLLEGASASRCDVEEVLKVSDFNIDNFDKAVVRLKKYLK